MQPDATPPPARTGPAQGLAPQLALLIGESQALRGDLNSAETARRQAEAAHRRTGRINLAVLGVLAVFVLLLLINAVQNNRLTHQLATTNRQIADCTTAGGKCHEEASGRTGAAINDIIRAEIFMAECSRLFPGESGPVFDRHLEQCVTARLAGPHLTPPTAPVPAPAPAPSTSVPAPSPGR